MRFKGETRQFYRRATWKRRTAVQWWAGMIAVRQPLWRLGRMVR